MRMSAKPIHGDLAGLKFLIKRGRLYYCQSTSGRLERVCFRRLRCDFAVSRRSLDARDGREAIRAVGRWAAWRISAARRSRSAP